MKTPTILYHKDHAPEGRAFMTDDQLPESLDGWHDTPAKFDPKYVPPPDLVEEGVVSAEEKAKGYAPVRYPTLLYQRGDADHPRRVESLDHHRDLEQTEPGVWKDTYDPQAWEAAADAPDSPGPALADSPAVVSLTPDQVQEFYKATVGQIVVRLDGISTPAMLDALQAIEDANPRTRSSVLKAIAARKAALLVPAE
jgi:hypothetical protein